jgi:hypothetical protein
VQQHFQPATNLRIVAAFALEEGGAFGWRGYLGGAEK